jgi:hypothetical protein
MKRAGSLQARFIAPLVCALLLGLAAPARAEEVSAPRPWQFEALVTEHRFTGDAPRADPDQPALRYGLYGLRWKAMAGQSVVLVAVTSDALRLGLSLHGFLELLNFDSGGPVPWQSYRANVGLELLAESPRLSRALLPSGGQLLLSLGWSHESDHAADVGSYVGGYLLPSYTAILSFDNGNFSSYEYVKLRAVYRQPVWGGRLTAESALGARLFPKAIDPYTLRALRAAVLAEGRLTVRATERVRPYASAYFELLDQGFDARAHGFAGSLAGQPLRYEIVHLGVDLVSRGGAVFSPFLTYSASHGRGIDFPRFYGPEVGFGLAIMP